MAGNSYCEFMGKGTKKSLVLELSESEDIFECIKQGMQQNNISRAKVLGIEGTIKEGKINYFAGNSFKSEEIENTLIGVAAGHYELKGRENEELFGNLHVVVGTKGNTNSVSLVKGTAVEGLKIKLEFVEIKVQ